MRDGRSDNKQFVAPLEFAPAAQGLYRLAKDMNVRLEEVAAALGGLTVQID